MISFQVSETLIKVFTSVLFRFLIIGYSLFLILIQDNFFNFFFYLAYSIFYFYMYNYLLKKDMHRLRTINDYIYIFIVLFDKDMFEIVNVLLIIFPIVNSPNHTQNKRQPVLLLCLSIITFILLDIFSKKYNTEIKDYIIILLSFLGLTSISFFEYFRTKSTNKLLRIYSEIDEIVSKKNNTSQLPEIYNLVKDKFNDDINFNIEQIISFQYIRRELTIKNSSSFVHSYNMLKVEEELKNNIQLIYNIPLSINNIEYSNNINIKINKFIFVLITNDNVSPQSLFKVMNIYEVMIPIFKKLINIIELENTLNKQKYKVLSQLNQKSHYVNNVMKSTHYLSNQFSPITNYFNTLEKYNILDNEDEKKDKLFKIIKDEEERVKISLKNIKEKSLTILDKEENPFIPKNFKNEKYKYVFMTIKNIWLQNFSEQEISVYNFENNFNKKIKTDIGTLEYIFTDIFENIRKNTNGYNKIEFDFEETIKITVVNNIVNFKKNKKDIQEIVKNYNNDDRIEINKRNSYGLSHLKELTSLLNIETYLEIDPHSNYFVTHLEFEKENNEKSSDI